MGGAFTTALFKRWVLFAGIVLIAAAVALGDDSGPGGLFSSGSSSESRSDQLFVAALTATTPYVELAGQRIQIGEAWLERRSKAVTTTHRVADPGQGLILVVRFDVPRSQALLLFKYYDPKPDAGGLESHNGALILISNINRDLPVYFLKFREHFKPDAPTLFSLELRRNKPLTAGN